MAKKLYEEANIKAIADAIRNKTGGTDKMLVSEMPSQIENITGGSSDLVKYVYFMSEDGTTELFAMPVLKGDDCKDPITHKDIDAPTKESSVGYDYTYSGWSAYKYGSADNTVLSEITEDKTVYASFTSSARYYTVSFYDGDSLVKTEQVAYGASSNYVYEKDGYSFVKWNPSPTNITGDMSCYAEMQKVIEHSWVSQSSVPYSARGGTAVAHDGYVYLIGGGETESRATAKYMHKYDGNTWTQMADIPTAVVFNGEAFVWNDEIHVVGAKNSDGSYEYKEHFKYSFATNTWETLNQLPISLNRPQVMTFNDEIYIIDSSYTANNNGLYKWTGYEWVKVSELPYANADYSRAVALNDGIHLLGGSSSDSSKNHYKWDGNTWASVGTLSIGLNSSENTLVSFENKIHWFKGSGSTFTLHYILGSDGSTWEEQTVPSFYIGQGSAFVSYNGYLHAMGTSWKNYYNSHYRW